MPAQQQVGVESKSSIETLCNRFDDSQHWVPLFSITDGVPVPAQSFFQVLMSPEYAGPLALRRPMQTCSVARIGTPLALDPYIGTASHTRLFNERVFN